MKQDFQSTKLNCLQRDKTMHAVITACCENNTILPESNFLIAVASTADMQLDMLPRPRMSS